MFKSLLNSLNEKEIKILKTQRLVIGVSGGPDSIYLLTFLSFLKNKNVIVCAINYSLRDSSKQEIDYVKNLSNSLNYRFFGLMVNKKIEKNIQDSARRIRFNFFCEIMKKTNTNFLLLGSTLDDLVESFYMNLITNKDTPLFKKQTTMVMNGFSYTLFRPLYFISKNTILEELRLNKVKFFVDKTNKKDIYLRNRIRNLISHKQLFYQIVRIVNADESLNAWITKIGTKLYYDLKKKNFSIMSFRKLDKTMQVSFLRFFLLNEMQNMIDLRNLGKRIHNLNDFLNKKDSQGRFRISNTIFISKKNASITIEHT